MLIRRQHFLPSNRLAINLLYLIALNLQIRQYIIFAHTAQFLRFFELHLKIGAHFY